MPAVYDIAEQAAAGAQMAREWCAVMRDQIDYDDECVLMRIIIHDMRCLNIIIRARCQRC